MSSPIFANRRGPRKPRSFRETFGHRFVPSCFDVKIESFLPNGAIEEIVTPELIKNEIKIDNDDDNILVEYIHTSARKLFAISAYVGLIGSDIKDAMLLFNMQSCTDQDLPFGENVFVKWERQDDLEYNPIWSISHSEAFLECQWKFIAPSFDTDHFNHDFKTMEILPFLTKERMPDRGAYGRIYRFEVHPNHIPGFAGQGEKMPVVAVKEIIPGDKKERQKITAGWNAEAKALQAMNRLNNKHIVHFVTAFRRQQQSEKDLYLMFEWADGGNLRQLWEPENFRQRSKTLIKAVVEQLTGLMGALDAAHNPRTEQDLQYRHGDIKPENILWFKRGGEIGTLKIGDWGEAKGHNIVTELRPVNTTAGFGTRRYEAPEVVTGLETGFKGQPPNRRSRLYDIWAMGCISLEFLVWLIYGCEGLKAFNASVNGDPPTFYQTKEEGKKKIARVHDVVTEWMDDMAKDALCQTNKTALGDLLQIIRDDLLVVKVKYKSQTLAGNSHTANKQPMLAVPNQAAVLQRRPKVEGSPFAGDAGGSSGISFTTSMAPGITTEPSDMEEEYETIPPRGLGRARSDYLLWRMKQFNKHQEDEYWFSDCPYRVIPEELLKIAEAASQTNIAYRTKYRNTGFMAPTDTVGVATSRTTRYSRDGAKKIDYGRANLGRDWEYGYDNSVTKNILSSVQATRSVGQPSEAPQPKLCQECSDLRDSIWRPGFSKIYAQEELHAKAMTGDCNLHSLLWRTCERNGGTKFDTIRFENVNSTIRMNGIGTPVLSISRGDDMQIESDEDVMIGFDELPPAESSGHFDVLRNWLHDCNENHTEPSCKPPHQSYTHTDFVRPTRLLDVSRTDSKVFLCSSKAEDTEPWIALSHQWGPDKDKHFSTNSDNVKSHMEEGLIYEDLPATFKNAVTITRELGCKYLWIDSLCIIQKGPKKDFDVEAKRMEMVYSSAYCVIAASRATGHYSGFLQKRLPRDFLRMSCGTDAESRYSICESIDKFNEHVLEGALNKRGWVLQEHALARRTLFFTGNQTYWECGYGVRCETMTHMQNELAALLGDPAFPDILSDMKLGERIIHFQNLYEQYSQLGLTNAWDRPTAIDSLQQRLLRTMNVRGGYGVFDGGDTKGLLRRSLLWHRDDPQIITFTQIPELKSKIPTWSWMAHLGAIRYFKIDFDKFDWKEITSPWASNSDDKMALLGKAQALELDRASPGESKIIIDYPSSARSTREAKTSGSNSETAATMMCMVLGNFRDYRPTKEQTHYFLVVEKSSSNSNGDDIYQRIGAGYAPGACIQSYTVNVVLH